MAADQRQAQPMAFARWLVENLSQQAKQQQQQQQQQQRRRQQPVLGEVTAPEAGQQRRPMRGHAKRYCIYSGVATVGPQSLLGALRRQDVIITTVATSYVLFK